jgi:hypothetical protein
MTLAHSVICCISSGESAGMASSVNVDHKAALKVVRALVYRPIAGCDFARF